jgi:hypothetical protein
VLSGGLRDQEGQGKSRFPDFFPISCITDETNAAGVISGFALSVRHSQSPLRAA